MKNKILILAIVQSLVLIIMIVNKQWTLLTGYPIMLETTPVDPRSLFRGDYVRLNYKISNLKLNELDGDNDYRPGDRAYVVLNKTEPYWQAVSVHRQYPQVKKEQLVIRGEIDYVNNQRWRKYKRQDRKEVENIHIRYGIENYFVPEGEGRELERRVPGREVNIQVAVDSSGRPGIKGVFINGEAVYVETLF